MKRQRVRTVLLAVLLVTACLIGQIAAVDAAGAAGSGAEIRGSGSITPGEPYIPPAGPKAATVQPEAKLTVSTASLAVAGDVEKASVERVLPTRDRGWEAMMSEGFEGVWPTGLWSTWDDNGTGNGDYCWDDEDWPTGVHTGSWSAWAAGGCANGLNPNEYYYPPNMASWMTYGPFDLSNATSADFEFYYWNNSEAGPDTFWWAASGNDTDYFGYNVSGDSGGWQYVDMDLSDYLGDSSVWLAFIFFSDSTIQYDGPFVDDVTLWKYTGGSTTADWTYMVYLDGDNNLESAAIGDFLEMSSVGSNSDVKIVVQMDRTSGYATTYDNWTDTRRFLVTPGMTPTVANGTSIGEVNMGDPATLVSFVQWAMGAYPADHYALVLWDHGSGWRHRALDQPSVQGIAYDDTSGGDGLDMLDMRSALNTLTGGGAQPFDLIGLDACLMAMIEVDGQMRPYADVRVTSQETEPGDGWPYDTILGALVANPTMTTQTLGTTIVNNYYASYGNDETQSAVDLGAAYGTLSTAVDNFAAALIANGAANAAGIQAARNAAQEFYYEYYIDLWDFADRVQANVANTAIDNAAQAVKVAVDAAVIHEQSGTYWPGANGISIYFPRTAGEYDARYDGGSGFLQFTAVTQWDEWIHTYYGLGPGTVPNDDFNSPVVMASAPYTNTQDVAGATTAADDPSFACGPMDQRYRTVWYRYTAPSGQTLTIDTLGTDYDTVLGVWTGSRGSLTSVACSDDAVGLQSRVEFVAAAGTTYHIEIASYDSSPSGSQLVLNLTASGGGGGWTLLAPMTIGRSRPAVAATGGKVYVIGGESPLAALPDGFDRSVSAEADRAVLRAWETSVEEYNPATNTWASRAAKPTGVSNAGAGVIGGIIYVPGGWDGGSASAVHEAYNPVTDTWSTKASLPVAVTGGAVAVVDTKLYVLGGLGVANTPLSSCYVYDQPSNTWSTCTSMSVARAWAGAAVLNGKIYVAGGIDAGTNDLSSVERYDPATNTWATVAPLSTGRGGPGTVGYNGLIYVCGGGWTAYLASCTTYNPGTNTWSDFDSMNVGRRTFGLVESGGTLYAEAGWNGTYLNVNEKHTIGGGSLPGAFGKSTPANGATGVGLTPTLSWGTSAGATSHEYCIDTTNNSACDSGWTGSGTDTSAIMPGLSTGTTYYWQVRALNASGSTHADDGAWWSFTTLPAAGAWTALAPMTVSRTRVAVAAVGEKVYAIDGESGRLRADGGALRSADTTGAESADPDLRAWEAEVEEYNPATNTWTSRAPKPTAVSNAGAGVIGGVIYVAGGYVSGVPQAVLEAFSPVTNSWSTLAPLPTPVSGGAVAVVGTQLFVMGGHTSGDGRDTCFVYDQPANAWSTCASLPVGVSYAGAAVLDGKIYLAGGFDAIDETNVLQRYDPATNSWATRAPMSIVRGSPGMVGYGGLAYVCGGGWWDTPTASCETYNPASDSWAAFDPLNVARTGLGMTQMGGHLYAIGGYDGSGAGFLNVNESAFIPGAPPGAFSKTAPVDGATAVGTSPTLSWGGSSGAAAYEYCYDTADNGTCDGSWLSTGTGTSASLAGLSAGTTYFWQVRATNGYGTTHADGGTWWYFTTAAPPGVFGKTAPAHEAPGQSLSPTLLWAPSPGASSYDYCIDTTDNGICDTGWIGVGVLTSVTLGGLSPATTYYWEVRAVNGYGITYANSGAWWSFATAPFRKLMPANAATGVSRNPSLTWEAAVGVNGYAYCYDTTNNNVCDGSWIGTGATTAVNLTGLASNTTYYWQVFASTSSSPIYADAGAWWSFTTGAPVSQQMTFHSTGTYDGWVLESGETTGIGGSRNSTATTARLGDDASDRQYRSLLHFNTTGLPDNAVITGVTLRIKRQSIVGTSPLVTHGDLTVDVRTGSFGGSAALANGDFKAAASGLNVGKFAKTAVSGWYRATLKSAVFPLVNRTGATQFRLRFTVDDNDDGAADYLAFYTGDSTTANRPDLIITYYLP